jgi:hypothetical protein
MAALGVGTCLAAIGCGSGDDTCVNPPSPPDAGADVTVSAEAGTGDAGEAGGPQDASAADAVTTPTRALLRLANWSADAPPIDFCLARHGTTAFQGPFLASQANRLNAAGADAGSGALAYPQVSAYLLIDPGQYDARLVPGGAADCAANIAPDATDLPALDTGAIGTVALIGLSHPAAGEASLQTVGFSDQVASPDADSCILRGINAAPDLPAVDVSVYNGNFYESFVMGIPYGSSSLTTPGSSDGYVLHDPIVGRSIGVRASTATLFGAAVGTLVAASSNVTVAAGTAVTFVVLPPTAAQATTDASSNRASVVECVDSAATLGLAGNCQLITE